jgi:hypothetical protein
MHSVYENLWKNLQEELTDVTQTRLILLHMCSVRGFCDDGDEHLDFGILNWQCVDCYEITIYFDIFLMLSAQLC